MLFGRRKQCFIDYFRSELATRIGPLSADSTQAIEHMVDKTLATAREQGLYRLDRPLGRFVVNPFWARSEPDYVRGFARTHDRRSQRWSDEGVTEAEVISYPDQGLLIHLCFAGLDRMFTQNLQQKLFTETAQVRLLAENDGSFRAQFDRF